MAYIDQARDPGRRATAILAVGAVHVVIAAGLLAGLKVAGIVEQDEQIAAFQIDDDPLPTPTPEPVPPQPADTIPLRAPLPPIPLPLTPGPTTDVFDADATAPIDTTLPSLPDPTPTARATPTPPLPTPSFPPKGASPRSSPGSWISTDDYPARPLRNGIEGQSGYRLVIGSDGRVSACEITASSGSSDLDRETCRLITRRARFEPATDGSGARVMGTYTGTVRWEIPD